MNEVFQIIEFPGKCKISKNSNLSVKQKGQNYENTRLRVFFFSLKTGAERYAACVKTSGRLFQIRDRVLRYVARI